MTHIPHAAAMMAAALLVAVPAAAQNRPAVSLTPVAAAQWDIAGHAGWLAGDKSGIGAEWDDWYDAVSGGVSSGRYLTPHLKFEVHAALASEGRIYGEDRPLLTEAFPVFRPREHYFRTATAGAGMAYQFFENQWFHPFVGAGLELLREHHRVRVPEHSVPISPPIRGLLPVPVPPVLVIPEVNVPAEVSYAARPFVTSGFKWYVAERAFLRASVHASFSHRGTTRLLWAAGVGADL